MFDTATRFSASALGLAFVLAAPVASAQDGQWRVAKVSGEAWIGSGGAQNVSMSSEQALRPGESVRTGRTGRVLLVRGAESILVSPNTAISLPEAGRAGMTTVIQQAGSILLDVEKRNVQHFEVETPYLAAVVKGTQFRVSIASGRAKVDVVRGQVQVADFRSGQFALVMPGQSAQALAGGATGLRLFGQGALPSIQQGAPQPARVAPVSVPARGLGPVPGSAPLQRTATGAAPAAIRADISPARVPAPAAISPGGHRIAAPIGEMKLDINAVTRGMARNETSSAGQGVRSATIWGTGELDPGSRGSRNTAVNRGTASGTAETSAGAGGAVASGTAALVTTATGRAGASAQASPASGNSVIGLGNRETRGNGPGNGNAGHAGNGNGNGFAGPGAGGNWNGPAAASNGNGNAGRTVIGIGAGRITIGVGNTTIGTGNRGNNGNGNSRAGNNGSGNGNGGNSGGNDHGNNGNNGNGNGNGKRS